MLSGMPDIHLLPDDKDALRAMIIALQSQGDILKAHSAELQSKNSSIEKALKDERAKRGALDKYITALEQQLAALRRARFGKSSEQLDQHIYQLELMLIDCRLAIQR